MPDQPYLIDWVATSAVAFEALGMLAFAVSGLLVAARKKLDIMGMAIVAGLTAFGGGTVRDLLLDRRPFYWVHNQGWVWVILVLSVIALFTLRARHIDPTDRMMQIPDAIGLGIFAASGTRIALDVGMSPLISVIMGTFTAALGGVARDIAVSEIPKAFIDHQPYAVIAFSGGWLVILGDILGWAKPLQVALAAAAIIAVRVLTIVFGWRLPTWRKV